MRVFLSLSALLIVFGALASPGCASSPGLTVTGSVDIDSMGTPTGFRFEQPVRLDGAAPTGAITGTCTLTSDTAGTAYGVVVDLYGPDNGEGRAARSVTLMTRTDATAEGTIEAELGADTFRGTCDVHVPLVRGSGQLRITATDCSIAGAGETATVDVDLTFENCTVTAR